MAEEQGINHEGHEVSRRALLAGVSFGCVRRFVVGARKLFLFLYLFASHFALLQTEGSFVGNQWDQCQKEKSHALYAMWHATD
jgi:hypothetical protein